MQIRFQSCFIDVVFIQQGGSPRILAVLKQQLGGIRQMSNVCCAMFNVVVKTPDDLLTKPPNPQWETIESSGHFGSESFYKFIGHRTTDIRHLTALAVVDFFTVLISARDTFAVFVIRMTVSVVETVFSVT